jgi:hypothetical protein
MRWAEMVKNLQAKLLNGYKIREAVPIPVSGVILFPNQDSPSKYGKSGANSVLTLF